MLNRTDRLLTSGAGLVSPTLSSGEDKIQPCWLEGHQSRCMVTGTQLWECSRGQRNSQRHREQPPTLDLTRRLAGALDTGPGPHRTDFHGSTPKEPLDPGEPPALQAGAHLGGHARRLGQGRQGCPKSPDPRGQDPRVFDQLSTERSSDSSPNFAAMNDGAPTMGTPHPSGATDLADLRSVGSHGPSQEPGSGAPRCVTWAAT